MGMVRVSLSARCFRPPSWPEVPWSARAVPAREADAARTILPHPFAKGADRGAHLEVFYGCLYYAALRPSEAVMLRELNLYLPAQPRPERQAGHRPLRGPLVRGSSAVAAPVRGRPRKADGSPHRSQAPIPVRLPASARWAR